MLGRIGGFLFMVIRPRLTFYKDDILNLNQVTLPVKEMDSAVVFYQTLGFTLIVDAPHYKRFSCPEGNATFSLILAPDAGHNPTVIYFEHEALDEWVTSLEAKGIDIVQKPTDESYLWREAIVHDPSGNKIKLYWAGENRLNPPWRVN